MSKFDKKIVPNCLLNMFIKNENMHSYNTRNKKVPDMYQYHSASLGNKFLYQISKLWLQLPIEIKEQKTLNYLQKKLKYYLLHNQ